MAAGHWTIRPRNRALRWSLFTLLGLAGAVVLLFGLIQTPPGKWVVARIASSAASGNGLNVRIEEIGGFLPWRITARRVVLSDPKGTFAEVRDLAPRLLLHASRLAFAHPASGDALEFESRVPF